METKNPPCEAIQSLIIALIVFCGISAKATDYQIIYLEDINRYDTITYCPGTDSLKFIAPEDANVWAWMLNNRDDTIYTEVLILPNGYVGSIDCQGMPYGNYFYINELKLDAGNNKTIICGETAPLNQAYTNFMHPENLSYSWEPASGLDNPTSKNPTADITEETNFYLTVTTPEGCSVTDSLKVMVNPLEARAEDVVVYCGNPAQLNVNSNYSGTGNLSYLWSPSDHLNSAVIKNPLADIFESATYSVQVTTPNGCTASSKLNVSVQPTEIPSEICMVSVNEENHNIVIWSKPTEGIIDSFLVYKELTYKTGEYELIGQLSYKEPNEFIDTASNALVQSNRYKIAYIDICGLITELSPEHKTMHLNINQGLNSTWNLNWEEYEGFEVASYRIYRGTTKNNMELIGSTAGGNTTFSDFNAPAGNIYYQLEVIPPHSCSIEKSVSYYSSKSNIASNVAAGISGSKGHSQSPVIYPVPVKDELTVNISSLIHPVLSIHSLDGRKIMEFKEMNRKIDVGALPKGTYLLFIKDLDQSFAVKFIKE